MLKSDVALNNLQWLICRKSKLNQTKRRPPELEPHHQMQTSVISWTFFLVEVLALYMGYTTSRKEKNTTYLLDGHFLDFYYSTDVHFYGKL